MNERIDIYYIYMCIHRLNTEASRVGEYICIFAEIKAGAKRKIVAFRREPNRFSRPFFRERDTRVVGFDFFFLVRCFFLAVSILFRFQLFEYYDYDETRMKFSSMNVINERYF